MATLLPILPHLKPNPLLQKPQSGYGFFLKPKPKHLFSRREVGVVKLGLRPESFDFDLDGGGIRDLLGRVEGILYTIADAVVSNSDIVTDAATKQNSDWLSGITSYMETILKVLKGGLSTLHVPYAYGFAIVLLTVLVKAATFPLTKKQVESAMAMKSLQPQIKAIQKRYAGDQERIQLETARLYKLAKINPLAGCLPTLATIPVWIGLYRALSNVADEGLLTEGFFWIPSLAGPTTIAARQNGSGISWLFPFLDGQPPLGWSDTLAYLVLPVLLVVSQYISVQIMQSSQSNDPNMKNSQAITKLLPLMIGYFSLSVPSGLSLYWFTNNILSTAQQVYLQKLRGAQNPVSQFSDETHDEDPAQILQSAVKTQVTKELSKKVDTLRPEGPRPGERFKQLKEQEARRRKQREEEKMKAEAAAAKGVKVEDQATEKEISITKTGNGAETDISNDSSNKHLTDVGVAVNGRHSGQDLQESNGVANVHKVENSATPTSSDGDGMN